MRAHIIDFGEKYGSTLASRVGILEGETRRVDDFVLAVLIAKVEMIWRRTLASFELDVFVLCLLKTSSGSKTAVSGLPAGISS